MAGVQLATTNLDEDESKNPAFFVERTSATGVRDAYERIMANGGCPWATSQKDFIGPISVREDQRKTTNPTPSCFQSAAESLMTSFRNTCDPFVRIELRGENFDPKEFQTQFVFNARNVRFNPSRDESEQSFDLRGKASNLVDASSEITDENRSNSIPCEKMWLLVQVLDNEGARSDRLVGESVVVFHSDTFQDVNDREQFCEIPIYDVKDHKFAGNVEIRVVLRSPPNTDSRVMNIEVLGCTQLNDMHGEYVNAEEDGRLFVYFSLVFIAYMLIGSAIYFAIEKPTTIAEATTDGAGRVKNYGDAVYFFVITALTVGYGDFYPRRRAGKLINGIFILMDTVMLGWVFTLAISYILRLQEKQFQMGTDVNDEDSKELRNKSIANVVMLCFLVLGGTLFFYFHEGQPLPDAFQWNFVTMSTVGYGDVVPQTPGGKVFTCIYVIFGVATLARFATSIYEYVIQKRREGITERLMARVLVSEEQILEFDENGDGQIDRFEFLSKVLVMTDECSQDVIDTIMKKFDEIDTTGDGEISTEDFRRREMELASTNVFAAGGSSTATE